MRHSPPMAHGAPTARRRAVSLVLGLAMLGAAVLGPALRPRARSADARAPFTLAVMIPSTFADWRIDAAVAPLQPDPARQAMLAKLYDQTLSRSYINRDGRRVMLSIAYGGQQSQALQLHLPEVCYAAQGFTLLAAGEGSLPTGYGNLPVKRLVARQDARNEAITYWITIGDQAVASGIAQKLRKLAYGLSGQIPDGMLVRVSTIEADANQAYRVHERFVGDLLAALSAPARARLLGSR